MRRGRDKQTRLDRQRADDHPRGTRAPAPADPPIVERPSGSITIIGESVNTGLHVVWTELSRHPASS